MKLLVFFILIPLLELYVLIQVGSEVGALTVVLWTVLSAFLGVYLMRLQGMHTMQKAQEAMQSGQGLEGTMVQATLSFVGGLLLFLPGLISDTIGILLLLPFVRDFLAAQAIKGMTQRGQFRSRYSQENVYEGDWQEKKPEAPKVLEGEVVSRDDEIYKR